MFSNDIKLALQSLRSTKWRNFLTMMGVIIGVFSVVVIVSIGVGIRQQITNQIKQLGTDLITVLPGENNTGGVSGIFSQVNLLPSLGTGSLSQSDLTIIGSTPGVSAAVPMATVTGPVTVDGTQYGSGSTQVIATTNEFPSIVNQQLAYGNFFQPGDDDPYEAIIGQNVALSIQRGSPNWQEFPD